MNLKISNRKAELSDCITLNVHLLMFDVLHLFRNVLK